MAIRFKVGVVGNNDNLIIRYIDTLSENEHFLHSPFMCMGKYVIKDVSFSPIRGEIELLLVGSYFKDIKKRGVRGLSALLGARIAVIIIDLERDDYLKSLIYLFSMIIYKSPNIHVVILLAYGKEGGDVDVSKRFLEAEIVSWKLSMESGVKVVHTELKDFDKGLLGSQLRNVVIETLYDMVETTLNR